MTQAISHQEIVQLAAKVAQEETIKAVEKERAKQRQERYDTKLKNTRLLLKNYRLFKRHDTELDRKGKMDKDTEDVLDLLWSTNTPEKIKVESITQSIIYTEAIREHIDKTLNIYRCMAETSGKTEEERRYRVLMAMYIHEDHRTAEQIAITENIYPRTVYKDLNAAIETMSSLIFGIDFMLFALV